MLEQAYQIPFVLGVISLMILVLVTDRYRPSSVFVAAVVMLVVGGSLSIADAISGISNTSILTIFILIIITAGINDHLNLAGFFDRLFGKAGNQRSFLLRMGFSVSLVSSVMNNTPVVAMMMPYVYRWGKKHNISPSRLLMPLSFSAIVGGVITLIGTSTNLVLNGLLQDNNLPVMTFTDFLYPGLLVTVSCILFIYLLGPFLMRDRKDILSQLEERAREYLVETRIVEGSKLSGKTIEEAQLRNLERVFLIEIIRHQHIITPVKPTEILRDGDILLFAGDTGPTLELIDKVDGLELSKKSEFEIDDNAEILESIVSQNSELERRTAKEVGFREKFDAAIIGIHRQGEKIAGKIGTIPLRAGDLLLLTAGPEFHERYRRSNDLLIINTIEPKRELPPMKLKAFLIALVGSVVLMATGVLSLFAGLLMILLAQGLLRMTNFQKIKQNVSMDLLIILVSSLAIGKSLIDSGSANYLTENFFLHSHAWNPVAILIGVFGMTFILTSLVTNVAAITIIFPIVFSLAQATALSPTALFLTAAFGASCCFATPFAYQTNLMVMEAGNYGFKDFLRFGLPMSLVYAVVFLTFATFKFNLI